MAASFAPFPLLRSTYGNAQHGHRRASSLGNLSGSLDALPRSTWMKRGPCVPYQHQRTEALRVLNSEEDGASGEDWHDRTPMPMLLGYDVMEERAKFTVYKILVRRAPDESWVIFRRYTDFCRLNDKVRRMCLGLDLPPKRWFKDNYDMDFLEARRLGLQAFLQNMVTLKDIVSSDVVRGFLCLDDPPGPFDSLEESRAYCETLEETNHRLQRELLEKQREIESLKRILEDRELQINKLEQTKNGVASSQGDGGSLRLVCSESCVSARTSTDTDSALMFKAASTDYVRNTGNSFEVLLPKRSYGACWSMPPQEEQECVRFHTSAILEDQV